MKHISSYVASAAVASALFLSGCGANSDAACAYGVEQDLDAGNYNNVISTLENNATCNGALSQNDAWSDLAGAYLGKAGITLPAMAKSLIGSTATDPMASFMKTFGSLATTKGLQAMSDADRIFGYIRTAAGYPDCNSTTGAPAVVTDSCFYAELANTIQTVSIMSAILGDATQFLTTPVVSGSIDDVNNNGTADELEVTGCAIADASISAATIQKTCSTEGSIVFDDITNVTFTNGSITSTLTPRTFIVDGTATSQANQTYFRLMSTSGTVSPVSTNGACGLDYTPCTTIDNSSCYPCPVVVDGAPISSTTAVLKAINTGAVAELNASDIENACHDDFLANGGCDCTINKSLDNADLACYTSKL